MADAQTFRVGRAPGFRSGFKFLGSPIKTMQIGSAMRGPGLLNGQTSNGTDTAFNSETWHYNESGAAVCAVAIVTSTWFTGTDANGAEIDMTGPMTVTGAIEYPIGTRTPVTWSASATVNQAAATNLVSDYGAIPGCIPAGALFGVREFGTVSSGVKWGTASLVGGGLFQTGGKQDHYESGAVGTITDKTQSGAPTATPGYGFRVTGVLAQSASFRNISLGVDGDSIASGAADGLFDGRNNTAWAPRAAGKRHVPVVQFGVIGTTAMASAVSGKYAHRLDAFQKMGITDVWLMRATNDLNGSRTVAQVQADGLTVANMLAASGIVVATNTLLPRHASVGADFGQTIARQVIPTSGPFIAGSGSSRAAYNNAVRTLSGPYGYYIETADALDVNASNVFTRDGGYWATGEPGGRQYLDTTYSGQVTGTPTTTTIPTNIAKAGTSNYFANYAKGFAIFADGVLRPITGNASGTITLTTALSAAPNAGDTVTLQQARMNASADGTHPGVTDNTTTAEFGAIFTLRDVGAAKLQARGF